MIYNHFSEASQTTNQNISEYPPFMSSETLWQILKKQDILKIPEGRLLQLIYK